MDFKVGDNAVYPGHGVAKITGIESKEIMGSNHSFYTLRVVETGMKVMVPQSNAESVGLRHVINATEADKVLGILVNKEKTSKIDNQTWNRRYREYMDKIKTGSVYEIAEVLRDLYLLQDDKDLSFGEKKMLDKAKTLLLAELTLAKTKDELKEDANLQQIFEL